MKIRIALFAAALVTLILVGACSDKSTEPAMTEGDPNSSEFVMARNYTEAFVDSIFNDVDMAMGFLTFDGSTPMRVSDDTVYIVFDESTCWWEIYASYDSGATYLIFVDSVRFADANGCQQFPDSLTTTELEFRADFDIHLAGDSGSISSDASRNLLVTGIQSDQVVFNGDEGNLLGLVMGQSSLTVDYDGSLTDLTFWSDDLRGNENPHPISGTLAMSMTITSVTPNGSAIVDWSIVITFGPDGYHARAESGNNYWEWDGVYDT
jgi:hypothetical protein